jgi:phage gpG-like protein
MTPEEGIAILAKRFKGVWLRVPLLVGNEAINFTLDNFRRQGFLGSTFQPWATRKTGWKKDKRKGRAILTDTSRLKRSIRITKLSADEVAYGTDVKYAQAHNEGLKLGIIQSVKSFTRKSGAEVKAHTRRIDQRIPKRQFMGNSPYLNARITRVVSAAFLKELK